MKVDKDHISSKKYPSVRILVLVLCLFFFVKSSAQVTGRQDVSLDKNWVTTADDQSENTFNGFEISGFNTTAWKHVDVPHNWDAYESYRRLKHGNRHGYAWYRHSFTISSSGLNKRYFLYFEGVGSFATVWLNGKKVGYHAGGRTTFTLDVTNEILLNKPNILAVRADHPAFINSLPWVCGGCSDEVGFSEGSQPMGIFRPVHLIVTNAARIEPFGVHIWNDTTVSEKNARLNLETEVKNYNARPKLLTVINKIYDAKNQLIKSVISSQTITQNSVAAIAQSLQLSNVHLWSIKSPYLYRVQSQVIENGKVVDEINTPYGIRWISWPIGRAGNDKRFLLNGKPEFINGIAEYEHNMGQSHAFSKEQIRTRVMQVRAAGFNAFRDAHQPHNLDYQQYWDKLGILWWPQFTAHIWYDTPEFRRNFKDLLVDWIKERRNSPSVILWGLQNESKLPTDFARECSEIIRKLDPTASSQRKITTCNGGTGTDWDVPQNWTGTYGGDPNTYATDIQKQVLIGEYGAWRSIDLHTQGPFIQNGVLSENRMTQLMETKVRLAESVKDQTTGQFFWLLSSHENPGRVQGGEGMRELDRIGPINYKGLFTPWGEPTDAFYMFRANYAPKEKEPMVYIVSHTWPDRWLKSGKKDSITVYSNCDEVELVNGDNRVSLGKKKKQGIGTHFQWDGVEIKYNKLKAIGYVNGRKVAEDQVVLNHLPGYQSNTKPNQSDHDLLKPGQGLNYLYRVNCGGPDYVDGFKNTWAAEVHQTDSKTWGSKSWTDDFKDMPAMFGSQRRTFDEIRGTADPKLFQTFRYGREKLQYDFPVADGEYQVELYFTEPWYGIGGGMDCTGWRLFDVAVNGKTMIRNLDIWKEAGTGKALKKVFKVKVSNHHITINFPEVASGQAIISAIAIAALDPKAKPVAAANRIIGRLASKNWMAKSWMDTGDQPYMDSGETFSELPSNLYGAEWIAVSNDRQSDKKTLASFVVNADADVYIALDEHVVAPPGWMQGFDNTQTRVVTDRDGGYRYHVYHRRYQSGSAAELGPNGAANNGHALMYLVAVSPVNKMERATDLKPAISYKTDKAAVKGDGVTVGEAAGKKSVIFKSGGSASWDISTGVADIYALRIKYLNPGGKKISAQLKVLAADGSVMKSGEIEFGATTAEKWKTVETTTGTSINAGNYKVIITLKDADGLSISGIEVQ